MKKKRREPDVTRSITPALPETPEHEPSTTAPGNDSGPFINLPWPTVGDDEHLYLAVNVSDETVPFPHDSLLRLEPGDIVIGAAFRSPQLLSSGEKLALFRIPLCLLDASAADLHEVSHTHLSGRSGLTSLVSQFLTALARTPRHQRLTGGRRLALNTADLVALLVGDVLQMRGRRAAPGAQDMLARIQQHIQDNLMDPDLAPESIARAHHISVRYLHKLFQSGGTTVSAWIRQRRLDACRAELRGRRRTVAAVANRWGFASPSHFSRLFRQTYGITPKEWQAAASCDA
ncbi:helix-turn-helix transcriptional regulator [Streptomyces olivaceoviridis]|uniref:Helix-turn-helix transcriptional regulator n=1 Tax=Streptomyces olivaceoviridis TaxID=1921 RepID=A0ABW7V2T7_STROI|nr:AraC family transcriptional regulator [Streptomyces corchorusii]